MNVILIGHRATGKSSVGKALAEKLQVSFHDTDDLVEAASGRSIREMVAKEGWSCFRKTEKKIISELVNLPEGIIATGGGAVMDKENEAVLKKIGAVVWLNADVETIVERIQNDAQSFEKRPVLCGRDVLQETEAILKERTPVYSRLADVSINTAGKTVAGIVNEIYRFLKENDIIVRKGSACREIP